MSDLATVLDPGRVAHASIQGYLYQAYLGVERWLELKEDEVLRCEGDEDLDRLLRDGSGGLSEQVKAYTGAVNIRDEVVKDTLRRFLVSQHRLRTSAEPDLRRFLFTSTATQRRQRTDDRYPVDVLAVWEEAKEDGAVRGQVVGVLREILPLEETADRPASRRFAEQTRKALTWLDGDTERWADLIRSVEWRLGEPQLTELRGKIDQALNRFRPGAPPNLRDRLLSEVLDASIAPEPRDRCRTREQLVALLDQAEAEVARWLATARGYGLVKRLEELDHLRGLLYAKPLELPPSPLPSQLLTAAYEVIPFDQTGREKTLGDLATWCKEEPKRHVRLFYGDGGLGKTRLLIEWCRQLASQGWMTGFLEPTATEDEMARLFRGTLPRLVVIDYAETRLEAVRFLVSRIARANEEPRLRLVLLARRAGDWWETLGTDSATKHLMISAHHVELPLLVDDLEQRRQIFRTAAHAFAQHLQPQETKTGAMSGALGLRGGWRRPDGGGQGEDRTGRTGASLPTSPKGGGPTPTPGGGGPTPTPGAGEPTPTPGGGVETPQSVLHERTGSTDVGASPGFSTASPPGLPLPDPDLTDEAFGRPLYLHMAALAAAQGHPVTRAADALTETLKRERRYWQDEVQDLDDAIRLDLEEALPAAVTALTLLGGLDTKTKAQELTRRLLPEAGRSTANLLATLLHRLYSAPPASGRHLGGLEPDLLGEELVWQELQQNRDTLHTALEVADPEGNKQLLTVLTRLAQRPERAAEAAAWLKNAFETKLDDLAEPALEVAVVQGDPVGTLLAEVIQERASLELAKRIMNRCDQTDLQLSVPLRDVVSHSTQRVYDQLRGEAAGTEETQKELARVASNLGVRLSDLGRREEALQATQEAVDLYRLLAQQRPDAFRPDLAMSLNNLGVQLSDLGRREEALQATQEAVEIRRLLAQQRPDAFRPNLAASLGNLSIRLSVAGQPEEALAAAEEGVRMLAPFFLRYPQAFEGWMTSLLAFYRRSCEEAGREPDLELLNPIEAALASSEPSG